MIEIPGYILLGLAIGAMGTLVGAGGGFILMPILLILFPDNTPDTLTAVSLTVVFLNAFSGTIAYLKMGRVNIRAGLWFAAAAVPGAIFGVWVNAFLTRGYFDLILGSSLVAGAAYLLTRSFQAAPGTHPSSHNIVRHDYNRAAGGTISAVVGFVSSLLGIGGGIVHVPALIYVLGFPAHMATATSHFVLAITAFTATVINVWHGNLNGFWFIALYLGIGVVFGAQLGARLSQRVHGVWIIRSLAAALLLVGARVILKAI
ncbi:MAG: sulfite exporter TauE/SafE family protein [Oligoflexales bacterium]